MLSKKEYFGQYGKITKLCVNSKKAYDPNNKHGPSFSAFVTFSSNHEAALAITFLDNFFIHGHVIRAAYGSNKYCLHFLKNMPCVIKDCMFIHVLADSKDILNKVI